MGLGEFGALAGSRAGQDGSLSVYRVDEADSYSLVRIQRCGRLAVPKAEIAAGWAEDWVVVLCDATLVVQGRGIRLPCERACPRKWVLWMMSSAIVAAESVIGGHGAWCAAIQPWVVPLPSFLCSPFQIKKQLCLFQNQEQKHLRRLKTRSNAECGVSVHVQASKGLVHPRLLQAQ